MKKLSLPVAVGIAAIAIVGGAWGWHLNSPEQVLRKVCLEALGERLRAPSTLKVLKWHPMERRTATKAEAIGEDPLRSDFDAANWVHIVELRQLQEQLFAAHPEDVLAARLDYEAANAYGVPIRKKTECTHTVSKDTKRRIALDAGSMRIDGKTKLDWSMDRLN